MKQIIDTGISPVADLKETKFVPGYDFVNDRAEAYDDNGHGTHVAGTVAQSTNNNYGVAGIAYEAALMPLKVLSSSGGGTVSDIAEAIKFAADNGKMARFCKVRSTQKPAQKFLQATKVPAWHLPTLPPLLRW